MKKSTLVRYTFALALTFFAVGHVAYAVSFNCNKAQTQVEKMICADATLSADDDQLAGLFKIFKEYSVEHDDPIYVGQRTWLKNIRNACSSADCLHTAYQKRIGYLKDEIFRIYPNVTTVAGSEEKLGKRTECELPIPVVAKLGCKIISACAENADYSFFQAVGSKCENEKVDDTHKPIKHDVNVYYYQNKDAKPISLSPFQVEVLTEIKWFDSDRNGFATLYVGSSCGNRDCFGEIFRYDPEKNEMYHFYEGSDEGIAYFDGYLMGGGKSSCCSYEVNARKINQVGARDVVDDKELIIEVQMPDEANDKGACSVSETYGKDNSQYHPAKLPNKKWRKYCATAEYNK